MKLLYSTLYIFLLFTSANAEWKMFKNEDKTFIFNSDNGVVYKLQESYDFNGTIVPETFLHMSYHFKYASPDNYTQDIE